MIDGTKVLMKPDLESKINAALDKIEALEQIEGRQIHKAGVGEPETILDLGIEYLKAAGLYFESAMSHSNNGSSTAQSDDHFNEGREYLRQGQTQIEGELVDSRNYEASKKRTIAALPSDMKAVIGQRFREYESNRDIAMTLQEAATNRIEDLVVYREPNETVLNDLQAYDLARVIRSAAKAAKSDENNYGCGFAVEEPETLRVKVTKLTKEQFIGFIEEKKEQQTRDYERLKKTPEFDGLNEAVKMLLGMRYESNLSILDSQIRKTETHPDNMLYVIPEEDAIEVDIEPGSDLDRMYAFFTEKILRSDIVRKVSPAVKRQYEALRERVQPFGRAPSLLLDHGLYRILIREFPVLAIFENPEAFKQLCDRSQEKGEGVNGTFAFIAGYRLGPWKSFTHVIDYVARRVGEFARIPNQFIDGK